MLIHRYELQVGDTFIGETSGSLYEMTSEGLFKDNRLYSNPYWSELCIREGSLVRAHEKQLKEIEWI